MRILAYETRTCQPEFLGDFRASLFSDFDPRHLNATHVSALVVLPIVSGGNHDVPLKDLDLETVREVAPFRLGLGQVSQAEFLLLL
jgi:hypothetical protein